MISLDLIRWIFKFELGQEWYENQWKTPDLVKILILYLSSKYLLRPSQGSKNAMFDNIYDDRAMYHSETCEV